MESNLLSLETLIKWIDINCDILPWSPELSTKREDRKELLELIGDESLDTILAAARQALPATARKRAAPAATPVTT